jgi:hypothetical protein
MSTTTNPKVAFEATADQIKEWKAKYGDIFKISIPEDSKACYVRSVDRKIMSFVSRLGNDPMRFNESLLEQCWLAGDEDIKTNDTLFISVMDKLEKLMNFKDSQLEKL